MSAFFLANIFQCIFLSHTYTHTHTLKSDQSNPKPNILASLTQSAINTFLPVFWLNSSCLCLVLSYLPFLMCQCPRRMVDKNKSAYYTCISEFLTIVCSMFYILLRIIELSGDALRAPADNLNKATCLMQSVFYHYSTLYLAHIANAVSAFNNKI